jgi:hypothetical protein
MLAACSQELTAVNSSWQREKLQFSVVDDLLRDSDAASAASQHEALRSARERAKADGRPSVSILTPYVSQPVMREVGRVYARAAQQLGQAIGKRPLDTALDEIRSAYELLFRAYQVNVLVFEQLLARIVAALEVATGDTKKRHKEKKTTYVPRNPHITQLYFLLRLRDGRDRTEVEIAKEFADRVGQPYRSLLRGVQRMRKALGD